MPPIWKYFQAEEVVGLDPQFVTQLDKARDIAGFPFVITSGFRAPEANKSIIGAVPNSAHLAGLAVDLAVENDHQVYLLIASGASVGITRYGIYINSDGKPTHVHMDVSKDDAHIPEVIWIKGEGKPNSAPATA